MEARYIRNTPALSEAECAVLRNKKVAVIGCGGLGGHLIELLSRVGVGAVRAVDGDVFEESNLNRQLLSEEALLGMSKAEAAANRIRKINSGVKAEAVSAFLNGDNAAGLIAGCDAVLDLHQISVPRLGEEVRQTSGCRVDGCQLTFTGLCGKCQSN